ncbi:MAG TPA: hypothetical protein VFV34_08625 [Blastocatellia bacterium]|nr:hypothetical protein [Blastocatellia bacterium]
MRRSFLFGFLAGLALLITAGVGASRLKQRDKEEQAYRQELVDATPVQLNVLTDKQRVHGRLYSHYAQVRAGRSISGLVGDAKGQVRIVETMVFIGSSPELIQPETPESFFGRLAQNSDAIIRGRVTKKTSQITEDDSFVFTDYDVVTNEVLKNNVAAPIETGTTITITRPAGKVVLDGVIVKATDAAFAPLSLNNEVVLFLKYLPETGTYQTSQATGSFELDGSSLRPLTKEAFPPGVLRGSDSFLQTVRTISKE